MGRRGLKQNNIKSHSEARLLLTFHLPLRSTWLVHRGNTPPASSPLSPLPSSSSLPSSPSVHLQFLQQRIKRQNMALLSVLVRPFSLPFFSFLLLIWFISRLGNNVRGVHRALILTLLTSFFLFFSVILVLRTCLCFRPVDMPSDDFFSPFQCATWWSCRNYRQ